MAVNPTNEGMSSAGRRFFFGTNVLLAIIFLAVIVGGVGWLIYEKLDYRTTLTGVGRHTLSDRTKKVVQQIAKDDPDREIRITTVYTTEEPGFERSEFLPPLRDYTNELDKFSPAVEVEHIHRDNEQKAELVERIQGKFGSASSDYETVITQAENLWDPLKTTLQGITGQITALQEADGWVAQFSPLGKIYTDFVGDLTAIEETAEEVNDLVRGETLPRYGEAKTSLTTLNDNLIQHFESAQESFQEWNDLMEVLGNADSAFVQETMSNAQELAALAEELQQIVGDPEDETVPDDPAAVLKEFAASAQQLVEALQAEENRVNAFVEKNPSIDQHPMWGVQVTQAIFVQRAPLPFLLSSTAEQLATSRQEIRQMLVSNQPEDILKNNIRKQRQVAQVPMRRIGMWAQQVANVFTEGAEVDEASRQFIGAATEGDLISGTLDQLKELRTALSDLPEIEIDDIGEKLKNENFVVIESGDKVQVLEFDNVWPISTQAPGMDPDEVHRVFDGDTAISGALIGMTSEETVATVVFAHFEPQSQNPMMRSQSQPPLPIAIFTKLRERLESANFEVKDWNLAAEGEASEPPAIEEGRQAVYVFFPPAISQQNPFQRQQQPPRTFGPQDMAKVKQVLEDGGRGIFLTLFYFAPPNPFMMEPPKYDYAQYLENEWGIDVEYYKRVIKGVVDPKHPDRYGITVNDWMYMQLSAFNPDHPIGAPLRNRRMLMSEVVPVLRASETPENVTIESVLEVPANARGIWAEEDVMRIMRALQSGESDSTFTPSDEQSLKPPFSVVVAATKTDSTADEETAATDSDAETDVEETGGPAKIVVMGNGRALENNYLSQRVMRFEGRQQRLVTDPPPTENMDLFVNAVYWLADKQDMIASGPATTEFIEPLDNTTKDSLHAMTLGWAGAVLMAGVVVFFVRRK